MAKLIAQFLAAQEEQQEVLVAVPGDEPDHVEESGVSLNAGVELDHEDSLGEQFVPEPAPDLDAAAQEIVALEHRIQDLLYLADDIEKTGGMSQAFALEAQRLLPGFDKGVPVGYYSKAPTATRYQLALEEIDAGVWALIAAGAAAVAALIYKLYRWLAGDKSKDGDDDSGATLQKAEKKLDAMAAMAPEFPKSLTKTGDLMHKANGLLHRADLYVEDGHGRKIHCMSLQQVIDALFTDEERYGRAKKFLRTGGDPMFRDILNDGPYSGIIAEIAGKFGSINTAISAKLNCLDSIIRLDINSTSTLDHATNIRGLDMLTRMPIQVGVAGKLVSMKDAAQSIATLRQDVMNSDPKQAMMFDQVFVNMTRTYRAVNVQQAMHQIKSALQTMDTLQKKLDRLQDIARDLTADGTHGALSQDVGVAIRQVIQATQQDIVGFGMLVHAVKGYVTSMEYLSREIIGFAVELIRKIVQELKKANRSVPQEWMDIMQDLKIQLKAISNAFAGFQ